MPALPVRSAVLHRPPSIAASLTNTTPTTQSAPRIRVDFGDRSVLVPIGRNSGTFRFDQVLANTDRTLSYEQFARCLYDGIFQSTRGMRWWNWDHTLMRDAVADTVNRLCIWVESGDRINGTIEHTAIALFNVILSRNRIARKRERWRPDVLNPKDLSELRRYTSDLTPEERAEIGELYTDLLLRKRAFLDTVSRILETDPAYQNPRNRSIIRASLEGKTPAEIRSHLGLKGQIVPQILFRFRLLVRDYCIPPHRSVTVDDALEAFAPEILLQFECGADQTPSNALQRST